MAGKPIRLGKAAGELNVGLPTLVEFLESKGIKIDSNPNTRLEQEHFELLCQEFAADQSMKEQSKATSRREKRESVTLSDKPADAPKTPDSSEDEDEGDAINLEEIKRQVFAADKPVAVAPEEPKAPEVVKEIDHTPEITPVESNHVNVIGKIDLSAINQRTRPDKRKEEPAPKAKATPAPAPATKVEEKPTTPIAEPKVEEKPTAAPVIETIRFERQVLSGPTVLGKIELPVERPRNPVASSNDDAKRKRKRIKKVETPAPNATPGNNNRPGGGNNPANKGPRVEKPEIKATDIQKEIKDTLARLSNQGGKSKASKNRRLKRDNFQQRRQEEMAAAELEDKILKLTEFVTVSELASMMSVQPTQVISVCMSLGIFASINQRLDAETIHIVADEFGFETEFVSAEVQDAIQTVEDKPEDLISRPPIITVMGHVDHGKTSLLDRIRNANVTEGEAGGITQHIGAYSVTLKDGRKMTFLDTPGHEAFTAMRARGAQVTDVAIIIVAADDDVMPQTKEAISHAQAANVPMIFAINKIDKPGANPDRIREQLSAMNILVEDWGGKYQVQEISARQNLNIDKLLEKVLLEAELLELKANPNKNAVGTVIESSLDKGKGYVTNMLVESGTMRVGDVVLVGRYFGKVRAMHDEQGVALKEAGPACPVSVLGIGGAPSAGDKFNILDDEKEAKSIATKREQLYREQGLRTTKHITLDEIGRRLAIGDFKELNIIVKGDVDGSIEALSDALLNLSTEEIQVNIILKGVGAITEADVNLASASDAIIIGFQVRPSLIARKLAENEQIDIRLYSVIYKAIEEIKAAMEGMLSPDIEEQILGSAEIRETFDITKVGTIAGCYVMDGIIKRSSKIRVIRDGIVVHTGLLGSLKRFKDDVREVKNNYECGLNIDKYNDIKIGDIVEAYEEVEVARKL
ncbi:MAG: translation initiation factor IF-2 [Crocinitomicaceae bacterium]|nr:translation initiation factor IF-2 [Crocinitomicaceae bacterium]MBP6033770.1 translation initiation factor IF-2 [Crocinitomicaceae bacterium]